jgi:hypothetical protein
MAKQQKVEPKKTRKRGPNKPKTKVIENSNMQIILAGDREAPSESRSLMKVESILTPVMTPAQMQVILGKTPEYALKRRPGRGGKTFKYVTYGYVVSMLNRAFGFDWDFKLMPGDNGNIFKLTEVTEELWDNKAKKFVPKLTRNISVYGELTVRIRTKTGAVIATIVKPGVGSQNWEATVEYGDACKGAKSDALKVAAHELGIGLDLYWDDQAELSDWENEQKEAEKAASMLVTANGNQVAPPIPESIQYFDPNRPPETSMELLVKAMTLFQLDGMNLSIKLGCSLPELMSWDTAKIVKAWEKLTLEAQNAKNES